MKPQINKTILAIGAMVLSMLISLLFAGCKKLFEDYDERTYYDVVGVGCVCYKETKEPAPDADVSVKSSFRSNGWATVQPRTEYYPVDSNGYFCVKFLKRTAKEDVIYYNVAPNKDNYYSTGSPSFTAEELQNAKEIIRIDTLWLYKSTVENNK